MARHSGGRAIKFFSTLPTIPSGTVDWSEPLWLDTLGLN
jgi:hypothetical protein